MNRLRCSGSFLFLFAAIFPGILLFQGCAVTSAKPVTIPDIVEMSRTGVPPEAIIDKMRESRTVYRLKADEIAELREEGVPESVVDYIQEAYANALKQNQALSERKYRTGSDAFPNREIFFTSPNPHRQAPVLPAAPRPNVHQFHSVGTIP